MVVAEAETNLPGHPAEDTVAPLVRTVAWILRLVRVVVRADDPPSLGRDRMQAAQDLLRLRLVAEQTEVVPEHDDRVEPAERVVELLQLHHPHVLRAALAGDLCGAA